MMRSVWNCLEKLGRPISRKLSAVLILSASILANLPGVFNGYTFDDYLVTKEHRLTSQGISAIPEIYSSPYYADDQGYSYGYRPTVLASFAIEHQLFGESAAVSHTINLLLFSLTCVLLLILILNVFPNATAVAFLSALLFAVHPIHTEVIANIKNRDELLALFFFLLSLIVVSKPLNQWWKHALPIAALPLFGLSISSKLSVLPLVVIVPLILNRSMLFGLLHRTVFYLGIIGTVLLVVGMHEEYTDSSWMLYSTIGGIFIMEVSSNRKHIRNGFELIIRKVFRPMFKRMMFSYFSFKGRTRNTIRHVKNRLTSFRIGKLLDDIHNSDLIPFVPRKLLPWILPFLLMDERLPAVAAILLLCLVLYNYWPRQVAMVNRQFLLGLLIILSLKNFDPMILLVIVSIRYAFSNSRFGLLDLPFLMTTWVLINFLELYLNTDHEIHVAETIQRVTVFISFLTASVLSRQIGSQSALFRKTVGSLLLATAIALLLVIQLFFPEFSEFPIGALVLAVPGIILLFGPRFKLFLHRFQPIGRMIRMAVILHLILLLPIAMQDTFKQMKIQIARIEAIRFEPIDIQVDQVRVINVKTSHIRTALAEWQKRIIKSRTDVVTGPDHIHSVQSDIAERESISSRPMLAIEYPLGPSSGRSVTYGTAFATLSRYITKTIVPYPLAFYYGYDEIHLTNLLSDRSLISMSVLILIMLGMFMAYMKQQWPIFIGLAIWIIGLVPFSGLAGPIPGGFAERLAYTPSVGFCLAVGGLVILAWNRSNLKAVRAVMLTAGCGIFLAATSFSMIRSAQWKDDLTLMRHDIKVIPNSAQGHFMLAKAVMNDTQLRLSRLSAVERDRRTAEAVFHYNEALRVYPDFFNALIDLGKVHQIRNESEAAREAWVRAFDIDPTYTPVVRDLALLELRLRNMGGTFHYHEKWLELEPDQFEPYDRFAFALFSFSDYDGAIEKLELAIDRHPEWLNAYEVLAQLHLSLGDSASATSARERAFSFQGQQAQ